MLGALGLFVAGCGNSEPLPLMWVSNGKNDAPASVLSNTFVTKATIDGRATAPVILDTGAPFSLLVPEAFGGNVPSGVGSVGSLTLAGVTLLHVPTLSYEDSSFGNDTAFGGIVGFTAFGQFDLSLNYRDKDKAVSLGAVELPSDLMPRETTLPFTLEGGGVDLLTAGGSAVVQYPASRVIVPVEIEGKSHDLLVDSGASVVGLRRSIFDELVADGRGRIQEEFALASQVSTSTLIRLRSVVVGGEEVLEPPAAAANLNPKTNRPGGIETLIDSLTEEVGRPVDGMLGGAVLREFYVTFGYPEGRLTLRRYTTRDHIHDEYRRVGIALAASVTRAEFSYSIARIYAGTDAANQIAGAGLGLHSVVVSIAGTPLASLDPASAEELLLGNVGDTRTLDFGSKTLNIRVDELLPLP